MDTERSGATLRALTALPSRRDILRGLAGSGLGFVALLDWPNGESLVVARKKRGKKKKHRKQLPQPPSPPPPLPFNQFGCLDIGQSCRGDSSLCCSGICDPKSSTCVAHNNDVCFADTDFCTSNTPTLCHGNNPQCLCTLTTGNAGFCADLEDFNDLSPFCRLCSTDTECQAELGPGAACVVLAGRCSGLCASTERTACMRSCV
jgi:hypothetical protein